MIRLNLLRFGFVAALLLGNWGGALAAATCPHLCIAEAANAGTPACCHRSAKIDTPHCHEHGAQATATSHVDEHDDGAHASRAVAHRTDANQSDAARSTFVTAQPVGTCTHCLSRPAPPGVSAETREAATPRHEASSPAPRTQGQTFFYNVTLTRVLVLLEHAPPPSISRHALLGIFLI